MIVDFDDFHECNHRLDLLAVLREANPAFRCTLFAIPALGSASFWDSVPDWCELAVHGWGHSTPYECVGWSYDQMYRLMENRPHQFVKGFKAPGWQISDGCYSALSAGGWWLADQHYNDGRRPEGLRVHCLDDGDHWHGHIQNVCGNGIEERFPALLSAVRSAETFDLISEIVQPWKPELVAA